jgi:mono/diheme cytochrome c family protein
MRAVLVVVAAVAIAAAQEAVPGLAARASDGAVERRWIAPTPNFHLDARESLHPSLDPMFAAEWTGSILITKAGEYEFDAGRAELRIDGTEARGATLLAAGRHAVSLKYKRSAGTASLLWRWRSADFPFEPVPSALLTHRKDAEEDSDAGRRLVRELGCANCHAAPGLERPGPVLDGVGSRVSAGWAHAWLADPGSFRRGATMPAMLGAAERADVAAYLAALVDPKPFRTTKRVNEVAIGKGGELFGTVGCIACHQQRGMELERLGSKYTVSSLMAYLKEPSPVEPTGRMPSMLLDEAEAFALAAYLAGSRDARFEAAPPPGDAARGKALAEGSGCLACHAIQGARSTLAAKPMRQLAGGGCLSDAPGPGLPRYRLTAQERRALGDFVREYRAHPDKSPAPVFDLGLKLAELRCLACHKGDAAGPLATLAEPVPVLVGVGAKLRTDWIERVLAGRERIRSAHEIRMPHYGRDGVRAWVGWFAKAEGLGPGDGPPSPKFDNERRAAGHGLLGTNARRQGMACIGCHDWGANKSLGEEGPQLINLAERLRWDWYERWMLNPARILSGTSMPNYFSSQPREKAAQTIATLWAGMELGPKAATPEGYKVADAALGSEAKPVPGKQAIVIRWDMPEATPAAIAVGLPGGLSYCFDAGDVYLRYAWSGGYLDMSGTLLRKTDGRKNTPTAALVGSVFWRAEGVPFRVGERDRIPQRRFRGYRIVDGRPEFRYEIDGVEVRETLSAAEGALLRELVVATVEGPLWFEGEPMPRGKAVRIVRRLEARP